MSASKYGGFIIVTSLVALGFLVSVNPEVPAQQPPLLSWPSIQNWLTQSRFDLLGY